jgi:hypothetical protein
MNREMIEQYAKGGEKLALAVRGLTAEDMQCFPPPDANPNVGKWSIQQVVIHLQDSDLIGADRMRRIIAEDNPTLIGYDETKFANNLFYHDQSVEDAITLFELSRKQFAKILRKLPDSAFTRIGNHNEKGVVTLEQQLKGYIDHLENHLKFIHAKRAKWGKEMW